jgi:hypothetical protein
MDGLVTVNADCCGRARRRPSERLAGALRGFARRERPHLGAQLSLFETTDG